MDVHLCVHLPSLSFSLESLSLQSEAVSIHLVISPTYLRSNSVPARLPQRTVSVFSILSLFLCISLTLPALPSTSPLMIRLMKDHTYHLLMLLLLPHLLIATTPPNSTHSSSKRALYVSIH